MHITCRACRWERKAHSVLYHSSKLGQINEAQTLRRLSRLPGNRMRGVPVRALASHCPQPAVHFDLGTAST